MTKAIKLRALCSLPRSVIGAPVDRAAEFDATEEVARILVRDGRAEAASGGKAKAS